MLGHFLGGASAYACCWLCPSNTLSVFSCNI